MKKLLSLLFASMVVFSLTMPAFASDAGTTPAPGTVKTQKAKSTKTNKANKTSKNSKTSTPSSPKTK